MLAHPAPVHRRPWSCLQLCLAALAVGLFIVFLALVVSAVERSSGSTIRLASANDADAAAKSFRDATSAEGARESLQFYSDSAHIAGAELCAACGVAALCLFTVWLHVCMSIATTGSARDKETAEYTARRFEEFGLEARVEEFKVLLNTPVQDAAVVQIVSPASAAFTATLKEVGAAVEVCAVCGRACVSRCVARRSWRATPSPRSRVQARSMVSLRPEMCRRLTCTHGA